MPILKIAEILEGKPTLDPKALARVLEGLMAQLDRDPKEAKATLKSLQKSVEKFAAYRKKASIDAALAQLSKSLQGD